MEVPPAMFPRSTRGLAGNSGGGSGGIGGGGGNDGDVLTRTRSKLDQGGSGAFLQPPKSSYRQHLPPGRKHPNPGDSGGVVDVISGTHTTSKALGEIDADSHAPHIPRDTCDGRMPSPTYPAGDVTGFASGRRITNDDDDSGYVNDTGGEGTFRAEAGDDSFLGFGFDAGHGAPWEQEAGIRDVDVGGRDRSASRLEVARDFELPKRSNDDGVDAEATTTIGCDLGWGETMGGGMGWSWPVDADGRGDGEGENGGREDREARIIPPTFSPVWKRGGQDLTRPSRARSSSFYEDDDDMMACIDGETPLRRRASSSSGTASDPIDFSSLRSGSGASSRFHSLAYSSCGEVSGSELDAWTRPRDNRSGLTASQAAAVVSSGVPRSGRGRGVGVEAGGSVDGSGGGGGGGAGSSISAGAGSTASSFGTNRDRLLRPNEEKALLEGLRSHAPGRKASSEASSDSDPEGGVEEDEHYYSGDECGLPPTDGRDFLQGDEFSACYGGDDDENLLPPLAEFPNLVFSDGSIIPRSRATPSPPLSHRSNSGDSTESSSILIGTSLAGSGEHMFPPGVDPFVSPALEGGISPPLSPPASGRGLGPPQSVSSSAAVTGSVSSVRRSHSAPAFPLGHLPPPQASPPRLFPPPSPTLATTGMFANTDSDRAQETRGARTRSWHSPAWPPATLPEDGTAAAVEEDVDGSGDGDGDSPRSSLAPATLESLHVSGRSSGDDVRSPVSAAPSPPPRPVSMPLPSRSPLVRPAPPSPEPVAPSPPPPSPPVLGLGRPAAMEASFEEAPSGAEAINLPTPDIPVPAPEMHAPAAPAPEAPGDLAPSPRARGDRSDVRVDSDNSAGRSVMPPSQTMNPMTPQKQRHPALARGGNLYGSGGGEPLCRTRSAGPALGAYSSGGSSSAGGGAAGGGDGISRLMGPDGPFGSNRPGYGGYPYAPRATYTPGGGVAGTGGVMGRGGGRSNLYGSDPGTMGVGSARHHGSTGVQGFLSTGGGARQSLRRGHGVSPQAVKIKLLMLGDSGVGKSSLMDRFTEDRFNISTIGTVGVDFKAKAVVINDEDVVVQVWDTAGQQRFHKITRAYYRGSHGIVLVYDVSDPETLDNIVYWMKSIRENAGSNHVQICLVGNKVDLREKAETGTDGGESDSAFVQTCSGRMIADQFEAEFFECSAKTGFGVAEAYEVVATKAYEAHMAKPPTPSSRSRRRLSRRKQNQTQNVQNQHYRHGSFGSEKDRPPRSDATWSTASSQSGLDSSAERLERWDSSTRLRHCSSDVSEASSSNASASVGSQGSPGTYSGGPSPYPSGHRSNAAGFCSSPTTTTSTTTHSSVGSPSAIPGSPPAQHQQPMLLLRPAPATPPPGGRNASRVGIGAVACGKKPGEVVEDDENSPTGTGTLSPLPGQQRSVGRASSLVDVENFFTPPLVGSPYPHPSPDPSPQTISGGVGPAGLGRPRADTESGNFVERVFGGRGVEADGGEDGCGVGGVGVGRAGERTGDIVSEVAGRRPQQNQGQNQQQAPGKTGETDVTPAAAAGGGGVEAVSGGVLGEDHPPPPPRTKGRRPPRVPRMRRNESPRAGAGGGRGKGVCKVS